MLNLLHEFWEFELGPSCHFSNPEKLIFFFFTIQVSGIKLKSADLVVTTFPIFQTQNRNS